jgi:hypothetical protein
LVSVFASKAPCTAACGPVRRCCQAKRTGTCYDEGVHNRCIAGLHPPAHTVLKGKGSAGPP